MMQFFRKYGAPVFALAAFTVLVWMVFELSGLTGSSGVVRSTAIGKVNGSSIDTRVYQAAVQQAIDSRQRQSGGLSAEDVEQIRNEVWDQFIQTKVMEAEFKRRGISASAEEVADAIRNSPPNEFLKIPDFQTDSQFDLPKYQRWLQSPVAQQYLPQLEAQYRQEIMRSRLLRVVTADVYLSDAALWQKYRDAHEMVKVNLAAITRASLPDSAVSLTPEEVTRYYTEHRNDFKRPSIAFLSFVALPRLADASDTAAALARAKAIRKEIQGGAPFAEVAKRESADSASAVKGGDLGEWTRGSFDPAFDTAAFAQPLQAISPPVLSEFGYHIIQVTQRKGNKATGRHVLIPIEVTGTHRDRLDAQADSLEELGAERLDPAALDTVARVLHLPIGEANPVTEGSRVQIRYQAVPDAGVWAFQAKPGETSRIIEVSYAFFLFRLDSLRPAGVPPLDQIRNQVEAEVRDVKKQARALELANELEKRVAEGGGLIQVAKALKIPNQEMGPFSRLNPPLPAAKLVGTAFGLDSGKVSGALDTKDGVYVVQVLEHIKPDSAAFVKTLSDLRLQTLRLARQERVRNYLSAVRDAAKVEDHRSSVFRTAAQAEADQARKRTS
ncbi:MAG: peptidylprolyl isomerase [Gemmatimonadales bacterium]